MGKWKESKSKEDGFSAMQNNFCQMLEDGRHIFDAAANALVGGTDPDVIRTDLFSTDRRINATEQLVRREILVHGTVHGAKSFPSLLVLMSLAKDAERIGDYAKNIFDLAAAKPQLDESLERAKLIALKDRISELLVRARRLYVSEDAEAARVFLSDCDKVQDDCDSNLKVALAATDRNAVGFALASRYFKRVTSHAANVVTSLVMPLDKLDFFDED